MSTKVQYVMCSPQAFLHFDSLYTNATKKLYKRTSVAQDSGLFISNLVTYCCSPSTTTQATVLHKLAVKDPSFE